MMEQGKLATTMLAIPTAANLAQKLYPETAEPAPASGIGNADEDSYLSLAPGTVPVHLGLALTSASLSQLEQDPQVGDAVWSNSKRSMVSYWFIRHLISF